LSNSSGIGFKCFIHVAKELHILKAKHGEFDLFYCPKCHSKGWNVKKMDRPQDSDPPEVWHTKIFGLLV